MRHFGRLVAAKAIEGTARVIRRLTRITVAAVVLHVGASAFSALEAQTVQAVLFFSPTCQHCHQVITQYLPVLFRNYGGMPSVTTDLSVPENQRSLHLFYNDQLQILLVDASKPGGTELYQASTANQAIPYEYSGVPRLVIGDDWLVGSTDIPERTGALVQQGLDQGGLGWPEVDGLIEAIASIPEANIDAVASEVDTAGELLAERSDSVAVDPEPSAGADSAEVASSDSMQAEVVEAPQPVVTDSAPADVSVEAPPVAPTDTPTSSRSETQPGIEETEPDSVSLPADESGADTSEISAHSAEDTPSVFDVIQPEHRSMMENFRLDPVGNGFSVLVLVLMIASVVVTIAKPQLVPTGCGVSFVIPILTAIGAVVASYLTYIEATGAVAVCGPVGDCNTVNQSEWAKLFGLVPVGALGLFGYVAITVAWAFAKFARDSVSVWASLSLATMALGGTLFSIYLTFLEPFVIGATCAWCLSSSLVITALLWLSTGTGREALLRIKGGAGAPS